MHACIHIYVHTYERVLISPEPDFLPNVVGRNRFCLKKGSVHVPNCKSFLVTEAERSMSSDAGDFSKIEKRTDINYFPARHSANGNLRHSDRNISVKFTIECRLQKLVGPV